MNIIIAVGEFLSLYGWLILGSCLTFGYLLVLSIMIRKVLHDRSLPEEQKPGPRPLFYLGQIYLGFGWPVPLFLILEALEVLN